MHDAHLMPPEGRDVESPDSCQGLKLSHCAGSLAIHLGPFSHTLALGKERREKGRDGRKGRGRTALMPSQSQACLQVLCSDPGMQGCWDKLRDEENEWQPCLCFSISNMLDPSAILLGDAGFLLSQQFLAEHDDSMGWAHRKMGPQMWAMGPKPGKAVCL